MRRRRDQNSNIQHPNSKEAPTFKLQKSGLLAFDDFLREGERPRETLKACGKELPQEHERTVLSFRKKPAKGRSQRRVVKPCWHAARPQRAFSSPRLRASAVKKPSPLRGFARDMLSIGGFVSFDSPCVI